MAMLMKFLCFVLFWSAAAAFLVDIPCGSVGAFRALSTVGQSNACRGPSKILAKKFPSRGVSRFTMKIGGEDTAEKIGNEIVEEEKPKKRRFFFLRNVLSRNNGRSQVFDRVPKDPSDTKCACGSKRTYENCCQKYHVQGDAPDDPVNLIRARYSAYAYRLPGYIMRTTDSSSPDWKINQNNWETEILEFCDSYKFMRLDGSLLGVEIEESNFSGADVAFVQFRAYMLGADLNMVEMLERSRIVRKRQKWLYYSGKLVEWVGRVV